MEKPFEGKDGDVKAGLSANIYGIKVTGEVAFKVDPVEAQNPETLKELGHLLKLKTYVLILRLWSVPAAVLTAVERFADGCWRPKVLPKQAHPIIVVVTEDDVQDALEQKLLFGQESKKLKSSEQ